MAEDSDFPLHIDCVPTLDLWMLLKRFPLPTDRYGRPQPGTEELHAALTRVHKWLSWVEIEFGLPSFADTADWAEFDFRRRQLGLCPRCRRNDGYLLVDDQYWAMCHRHRTRWEVSEDAVYDFFVADGTDAWNDRFRPVFKYQVVTPIHVADSDGD